MEGILVPIFVCCVLPVAIVLIIFLASMNSDNKRAAVLIKALETDNSIDAEKLAEALGKPKKSPAEILAQRLLRGCIFTLSGIVLCIAGVFNECGGDEDIAAIAFIAGGIALAVGISYLVVYFVTRRQNHDSLR